MRPSTAKPAHLLAMVLTIGGMGNAMAPGRALAQGAAVTTATAEEKAQASALFREARAAYDERRFVDALRGFQASYDVVASPNAHLMVGHTLRELGRNDDAYETFKVVEEEATEAARQDTKYEATVERAREERARLRGRIGLLTVVVPRELAFAAVTLDGKPLPSDKWQRPIAVAPGDHRAVLTVDGRAYPFETSVGAGGETTLTLRVPGTATDDEPPDEGDDDAGDVDGQRIGAYVALGVGGAAFITAGVLGGLAAGKHGDLEETCGDAPCPERQDDIDAGKTFMNAANAMIVVGAVGVALGGTLLITSFDFGGDDDPVETTLRIGPTGLWVEGRF